VYTSKYLYREEKVSRETLGTPEWCGGSGAPDNTIMIFK
tara:strand:- start:1118 stop:1234 length:117 start_codon:yes stop_codon:yes gene_type:complete